MGKKTALLSAVLAILAALLPIEMGEMTRFILTAAFGLLAGVSEALHASAGKSMTVVGVLAVVIGTVAAPEVSSLASAVLSTHAAEVLARIAQIGGAVLAAIGAPVWRPSFPNRTGSARAGLVMTLVLAGIAMAGLLAITGAH